MFCCVANPVQKFLKPLVAAACLLLLLGPALISLGTILILQDSKHEAFSSAVRAFDPEPIKSWLGTINGKEIVVRTVNLDVTGVSGVESVFAEANISSNVSSSTILFPINVSINIVQDFLRNAFYSVDEKTSYSCSPRECKKSLGVCTCSDGIKKFERDCTSSSGKFIFLYGNCVVGTVCGRCEQRLYLRQLYLVVEEISKGQYREDVVVRSAKYDFSDFANDYQLTPPPFITVRLYSGKDPFIALQRVTKGTQNIGESYRMIGIVALVSGVIMFLLGIILAVILICHYVRKRSHTITATEPFGGTPKGAEWIDYSS